MLEGLASAGRVGRGLLVSLLQNSSVKTTFAVPACHQPRHDKDYIAMVIKVNLTVLGLIVSVLPINGDEHI
jgi:hypothetical protein